VARNTWVGGGFEEEGGVGGPWAPFPPAGWVGVVGVGSGYRCPAHRGRGKGGKGWGDPLSGIKVGLETGFGDLLSGSCDPGETRKNPVGKSPLPGIQKKEGEERGISHKMHLLVFPDVRKFLHPGSSDSDERQGKALIPYPGSQGAHVDPVEWLSDPQLFRSSEWPTDSSGDSPFPTAAGAAALPSPAPSQPAGSVGAEAGFKEKENRISFCYKKKNINPYNLKKKIPKFPVCLVTETTPP